jgi:hypothetical protein
VRKSGPRLYKLQVKFYTWSLYEGSLRKSIQKPSQIFILGNCIEKSYANFKSKIPRKSPPPKKNHKNISFLTQRVYKCDVMWCDVMWCDVMWCDVMWCDVMKCDVMHWNVMWCDIEAMWCDVTLCYAMWCYVMWYRGDVMWCYVMWYQGDVMWCDVMWCDVM